MNQKIITNNIPHKIQQQINDSLKLLHLVFGKDLLGVYLYGSTLVGGLQKYSDIDLLVVANRATTPKDKNQLIENLLNISGIYMKSSQRPLEITIVEKKELHPWRYPPLFDFQYGEWLRQSFEKGINEPWHNNEMPDLALIVTQVLLKCQTLWGSKPQKLLPKVPYRDFINAMLGDLDRLITELSQDTRNVLLTLARIWSTVKTNAIRSKPAAADWAFIHLPEEYQPVLRRAKLICIGQEEEHWADMTMLVKECADFMLKQIQEEVPLLNLNAQNLCISLAEELET